MTKIRLACAALNQTPLAWDCNLAHILQAIEQAQQQEVGVLCLPELCISGYGCEDQFFSSGVYHTSLELLQEIVPQTDGLFTCLGIAIPVEGVLYNAEAVVCDGWLLGFVAKQFLADDGIHYEPRWFRPWPAKKVVSHRLWDTDIPCGDLLFDVDGVRIGLEICRDAWVADRPAHRLAARGADIILNPSASHFAFSKQETRRQFALDAARDLHVSFAYSNLLGNESGRAIFDGGSLIATAGEIVAAGPRFSFDDVVLTTADVDIAATRAARAASDHPLPQESTGDWLVPCPVALRSPNSFAAPTSPSPWDTSPPPKEEEFARAVSLGLFDYLRKSRAPGFVLSLSGGADSSTVATLVWLMSKFGIADIGSDRFWQKLNHPTVGDDEAVGQLLSCVYQATRNSSETTFNAAQQVAESIGARFLSWNVDELIDGYVEIVSQAIGRELTWESDDVPLQNIQARARGPGAWLLANLTGALLLATSNRSEAAVGYATMDGDTCGGLSPISGIDKAFLLDWLDWMQQTGPAGVGPLPTLAAVTAQQPTAELRPASSGQTDEADLMPYRVLDAIERAAIRDKQTPLAVFGTMQESFPEHPAAQLGKWVDKFFRLWCRNQWKRERYAPSFHLDDENLDPKTWCRFPILSGGFERELAKLQDHLQRL